MSVNKAILIGNLGADPETRTAQSGTMVANLRIATNEKVKRGDSWDDHVEWHRVVCFGRTAENVARYLSKGRQVYVEGRIRTNKWQDRDGVDRWSTEIIADKINFLGGGNGNRSEQSDRGSYGGGSYADDGGGYGAPDDDIPFLTAEDGDPAWVRRLEHPWL